MNRIKEVLLLYGDRVTAAGDILQAEWCFVTRARLRFRKGCFQEHIADRDNLETLTAFMDVVPWEVRVQRRTWEQAVKEFCQDERIKLRVLAQLVRTATTGSEHGPSLFGCLEFLGDREVKARVELSILLGLVCLRGVEFTGKMWL